jgi:nucleoside-diphosphate-sugar epimerase
MEILITGATGFLGRYLIPVLQERGDTVRALVLPNEDATWLKDRGVAIYLGDTRQPDALVEPMRAAHGVFHLAAMTRMWRPMQEYHDVNVAATKNVCQAVLAAGVRRMVHVSSGVVYGLGIGQPAREDFPLAPIYEPYSVTKAEADKLILHMIAKEHLPAVVVRPGTIFGPGDSLNFGRIADRLCADRGLIIGSGENALTLVYVTDVIQGLLLAFDHEHAVGNVYNIANDQPLTQKEFLSAIAEEVGARPPRLHMPYSVLYALASASERVATLSGYRCQPLATRQGVKLFGTDNRLSIDKARRELGYTPQVRLREGISLAGSWYRQQRPQVMASV